MNRIAACIANGCGIPLDIAEQKYGKPTDAEKQGKAFAERYCRKCLARKPVLPVIVEIPVRKAGA